jgi:tRNA(adenine34) deaminase
MVEFVDPMDEALRLARQTGSMGNVPIGAVVIHDGHIVARAANLRHTLQDPTAHAEMLAIRQASQALGTWRLDDATLFVTVEPCAMCAAAIRQSRIGEVVYGTPEPKTGAIESCMKMLEGSGCQVTGNHRSEACAHLLQAFFEGLRARRVGTESEYGEMAELVEGA